MLTGQAGAVMELDPFTQCLIQSGTENLWEWRLNNLPRQPAVLLGSPHGPQLFPYIQSELVFFQVMLSDSRSTTMHSCEVPGPIFWTTSS